VSRHVLYIFWKGLHTGGATSRHIIARGAPSRSRVYPGDSAVQIYWYVVAEIPLRYVYPRGGSM
jgi:hypothetical protein